MDNNTKRQVDSIIDRAKRDYKGDYRLYKAYRSEIESLMLSPEDYQKTIRKLANALKV